MKELAKGVDVSTHNGAIDWKKVKQSGISFAIIRAGFGNTDTQRDAKFIANMNGALEAGLKVGAYWFSYALTPEEAKKEAEVFAGIMEPYRGRVQYPLYYDYEYDSQRCAAQQGASVTRELVTAMTEAFCSRLRELGWYSGYYTNLDYLRNWVDAKALTEYSLWLADYTGGPDTDCGLCQTGSTGKVNGISGNVDTDIAYADLPTLIRKSGLNGLSSNTAQPSGTCTGNGVRIRKEAHTAGKILAHANMGDQLLLLDDDGWGWSKVQTDSGVTGWIYNRYLNAPNRSASLRVVCNGTNVNLRESPSLTGKVLRQLQPGDEKELVCILPSGWLDVGEGYLYYDKSYLSLEK